MHRIILLSFFISSIFINSCTTKRVQQAYKDAFFNKPYDVVIVPTLPYKIEEDKYLFVCRTYWSKLLVDQEIAENIIFTGGARKTPYVESIAMKLYAEQLGVPSSQIIVETDARFDAEYLFNSLSLCKDFGFKKIALATDVYQMSKLKRIINEHSLPIELIPVNFSYTDYVPIEDFRFNDAEAYVENFIPLHKEIKMSEKKSHDLGVNLDWTTITSDKD